ncbi:hypothetical protein BaRGS_00003132 [Batillaria attramentaria]|uniref:C1q domain-containing protein n=1 Tax=Batillaria attramentaria TaxID=370345 RepID=A0ABD0M3G7_9CAEN
MKLAVCLLTIVLICGYQTADGDIIPGHRAKRSDDPQYLETVLTQLSNKVNELEAQVAADKNELSALRNKVDTIDRRVAFLVQIANDRGQVIPGHAPYKFDQIVLNDGNAYDETVGVFTAPYAGVYMLAVQVFTEKGENPLVDIRVNNRVLTRMSLDTRGLSDSEESDSTAVVTKLETGDKVWVEADGDWTYWGDHHTFFSGALLYTV